VPNGSKYERGAGRPICGGVGRLASHCLASGISVDRAALRGHSVLVLEDEPLIALDICEALKAEGASVLMAHGLRDALALADHPDLSAAMLDFGLRDGDAAPVCERLNKRAIPFVLYSGYEHLDAACHRGVILRKPATRYALVKTLARLLAEF
jgi:CheY-like chemotaxis protein